MCERPIVLVGESSEEAVTNSMAYLCKRTRYSFLKILFVKCILCQSIAGYKDSFTG